MKKLLPLIAVLLLTACGTTSQISLAERQAGIPAGQSRLIFERTNSPMFIGAEAEVKVDGQTVAKLGMGGQAMTTVKAGAHAITASNPMGVGAWTVAINAKAGKTYTFEIEPQASAGKLLGGIFYDALNSDANGGDFKIERK